MTHSSRYDSLVINSHQKLSTSVISLWLNDHLAFSDDSFLTLSSIPSCHVMFSQVTINVRVLTDRRVKRARFDVETKCSLWLDSLSSLLRMLSLRNHILTNLKCASEMLSATILKRNVTRLKIETIDYTSRSFSILAAQTSRFLLTFFFFLTLQTQIYMSCTL
jgi:hypothetical protein